MRLNQKIAKKLRKMAKSIYSNQRLNDKENPGEITGYLENTLNRKTHHIDIGNDKVMPFETVGTLYCHNLSERGIYRSLKRKLRTDNF